MKTNRSLFNRFGKTSSLLRKLARSRNGQTLVEYSLIIAMLVVVTITVLVSTGTSLKGLYSTIGSQVARAQTGS